MTQVAAHPQIDRFYDDAGFRLRVGTRALYWNGTDRADDWVTIIDITDWDVNDQDAPAASFVVPPHALVRFDDGECLLLPSEVTYAPQDPFDRYWELLIPEIRVYR